MMMTTVMPIERDCCSRISNFDCLSLLSSAALLARSIPEYWITVAVAGICGNAFI
jgi:hypothetical protein